MTWTVIELRDGEAEPIATNPGPAAVGSRLRVQGFDYDVVLVESDDERGFVYVTAAATPTA
jgi:hypothetical protein